MKKCFTVVAVFAMTFMAAHARAARERHLAGLLETVSSNGTN